jgi:thiamine pyrophosphate-dependent acetolactate synthase large subunit-like protein
MARMRNAAWAQRRCRGAIAFRPAAWAALAGAPEGPIHPATLCHALRPHLAGDAVLVCDGGEIGQWAQAILSAPARIINGVAGAIGAGLPFALAARAARPGRPILAVMGDGTFGFHMAEFDTALRHNLPFVAVVGNDAKWNAEHQIQLREYGANRAHGCELAPGTRYDLVRPPSAASAGMAGIRPDARGGPIAPALERAFASGKPACVNVLIERAAGAAGSPSPGRAAPRDRSRPIGTSRASPETTKTFSPIGGAVSPMPTTISTRMPNQIAVSSVRHAEIERRDDGKKTGSVSRIIASSSITAPSTM